MNNQTFIQQFEEKSLDPEYFNHMGHIRICWLYLTEFDLATASDKVCNGIKTYAESLGAKDKFNLTLTRAFINIMAKRMAKRMANNNQTSWVEFCQQNNDLVESAETVLKQHYSDEVLSSERARLEFVAPDKAEF